MRASAGGTGLYELPGLEIERRVGGDTPFGTASGKLVRGHRRGVPLRFLARHGAGHRLPGISAVGSLAPDSR
jgi:purine nucleoside phosphorylase